MQTTQITKTDLYSHHLAQPIGQVHRFLLWKVYPNGGCTTGCINHAWLIGQFQRCPRFKRGACGVAGIHLHQHIARVFQLFVKIAKRIDDDLPPLGLGKALMDRIHSMRQLSK